MDAAPLILPDENVECGGKGGRINGDEDDYAYHVHNANIAIRMAFLRKVYGLLTIQLLMMVGIVSVFLMCDTLKLYVQQNPWMTGVSFLMTIGIMIALIFKKRDHPVNLILLALFTLFQSYTVAVVTSMFDSAVVLEALFITFTILAGLTAYTFQTKKDFSYLGYGLFIGISMLLLGGILQIFLQNSLLEIVITIGGALLFSLFIIYDTQLIMRKLSPEEYILATINLYLDIVNLFLYILRAIAISRK